MEEQKIKLSVIIPVYNAEKYIVECLDSIYNQNLNNDEFEVIIVNDGSKDHSQQVIEDCLQKTSNAILINQQNQGVSQARNNGLSIAKGEYVIFIDSDDFLIPNYLDKLLKIAIDNSLDILKANMIEVDDNHLKNRDFVHSLENKEVVPGVIKSGEDAFVYDYDPNASYVYLNLYRRFFLQSNKLSFVRIPFAEDVIFTVHSILKAEKFMFVPTVFYVYRHNDTSAMGTMNATKLKSMNVVIANLKELKNSTPLSASVSQKLDDTIFACLSVELWYLSHYKSIYPYRKEVISDLKMKVQSLYLKGSLKHRFVSFVYKYCLNLYITIRYLLNHRDDR